MAQADPRAVAAALGPWFRREARPMTWRGTRDPYAIWVSEIMLQQTRVDTVERHYSGFMRRFPSLDALAAAEEEEVVEAWSGLGYYRRARFLHRGARYVVDSLGGEIPRAADALRSVPGIGAYTAGAIASIAFDRPEPLVDGNVARVSSRLRLVGDPKAQVATHRAHWSWVEEVLCAGRPRVLAQALMELGATVCTPRSPRCDACPVRELCGARATGRELEIPAPKRRAASPRVRLWAPAIAWGDRILLERRPDEGLLAGMWCLPVIERSDLDDDVATRVAEVLGMKTRVDGEALADVVHTFTHRVWVLTPVLLRAVRRPALTRRSDGRRLRWVAAGERPPGGVPRVTEKLLAGLAH
jgi:A/G-specific adenine glycosylase